MPRPMPPLPPVTSATLPLKSSPFAMGSPAHILGAGSMMPAKRDSTNRLSGLSASIVATLKERIVGWKYPPEHRLTEEGLCREFGVSRSPVREALRALVTNGFVRKLQNRGYA